MHAASAGGAPLGVTDAGWGPQAAGGSAGQPVAHIWASSGSWVAREAFAHPPVNNSSGRAHMSLARWGRVLREVLRVEAGAPTLASADAARPAAAAVTVNATTGYALGWLVSTRSWANGKVLFHDGSNGANHSLTFVAPQRNVAFLATTNGFDAPGGRTTKALDALIGRLNVFHTTGH